MSRQNAVYRSLQYHLVLRTQTHLVLMLTMEYNKCFSVLHWTLFFYGLRSEQLRGKKLLAFRVLQVVYVYNIGYTLYNYFDWANINMYLLAYLSTSFFPLVYYTFIHSSKKINFYHKLFMHVYNCCDASTRQLLHKKCRQLLTFFCMMWAIIALNMALMWYDIGTLGMLQLMGPVKEVDIAAGVKWYHCLFVVLLSIGAWHGQSFFVYSLAIWCYVIYCVIKAEECYFALTNIPHKVQILMYKKIIVLRRTFHCLFNLWPLFWTTFAFLYYTGMIIYLHGDTPYSMSWYWITSEIFGMFLVSPLIMIANWLATGMIEASNANRRDYINRLYARTEEQLDKHVLAALLRKDDFVVTAWSLAVFDKRLILSLTLTVSTCSVMFAQILAPGAA